MPQLEPYFPRLADDVISGLIAELPVVMVVGPRAAGKTTTSLRFAATAVRLDNPAQSAAVSADPDATLERFAEPVLLDEWQAEPAVLGAVKRAVDVDFRPGRFILTGSARADLDAAGWPGTGRLVRVTMNGLTVRELNRLPLDRTFLESIAAEGLGAIRLPAESPDLPGYLALATRGGFPQAALTSAAAREELLQGYVDQLVTRDIPEIGGRRDPHRVRSFLNALALNTAGVTATNTLCEAAGIDFRTAKSYESLLSSLCIYDEVPAWSNNRLKRLTRAPKRYLSDSGLAAATIGVDVDDLLADGDLLGRMLDTFVAAQLRAELASRSRRARMFHLRQESGHEVDIVIEFPRQRVLGLEIKATSAPRPAAAKHLLWMRDELGDKFIGGVVLHTGPHVYPLGDRIIAAPISSLWG